MSAERTLNRREAVKAGIVLAALPFVDRFERASAALNSQSDTKPASLSSGGELPETLTPLTIIEEDKEAWLPERGRFATDYLGKMISFEAPINGDIHTQPSSEGSPQAIMMEYPDPDGSTTYMHIAAIDLRHHTSLEGRANEHMQALINTQAASIGSYDEPRMGRMSAGEKFSIFGKESILIQAYIPDEKTQEPLLWMNSMCIEGDQTWEATLSTQHGLKGHRVEHYKSLLRSLQFIEATK